MTQSGVESDGRAAAGSLAEKLNKLYETMSAGGGERATDWNVASGILRSTGVSITASYLNALRNGKKTNPRSQTRQAICAYFGVNPDYLNNGPNHGVDAQLNLVRAMKRAGALDIATRGAVEDMSPEQLNELAEIISEVLGQGGEGASDGR